MKLDIINGEHQGLIFPAWRLVFPMTPKGIILPTGAPRKSQKKEHKDGRQARRGAHS